MFTVVCLASKSETARVGFYCGRGNQNTITSDVQSERNFCDWQHAFVSRNQSACFACVSIKTMGLHRGTNATDKKGGKKKLIPYWPVTYGTKRLPCVHTEEVQTHFMIALSCVAPHHLSTQWWTQEALVLAQADQHHSFTRLLGAFVRWLLAEKGKQINTSPMGLTGNLYLGWNMSTSLLDSLTVTGQLTSCTEAIPPLPGH